MVAVASRSTATMETRSTARNRTSIDHGAEDAPAAETGCFQETSANASTHADNAEAAVMASADLMGGQQFGAESPDASDAENAPPRSSSCPPARGRQTSAVQPGPRLNGCHREVSPKIPLLSWTVHLLFTIGLGKRLRASAATKTDSRTSSTLLERRT